MAFLRCEIPEVVIPLFPDVPTDKTARTAEQTAAVNEWRIAANAALSEVRSLVAFHLYGPVVRRVSRFLNVVFFCCADCIVFSAWMFRLTDSSGPYGICVQ